MDAGARIFVAGHGGLVGSAVCRELARQGYCNVLTRTRTELDLLDRAAVAAFFAEAQPEFVVLAAAKVGGILANREQPVEFLRENLLIQGNVIDASFAAGVRRLLFLASSAIYPRDASQPLTESSLLSGLLEPSNRGYSLAKIAGIELCWSYNRQHGTRYLAAAVANVYGPGDHFEAAHAHVLAALLRRTAEAKAVGASELVVWGTGTPRREMLYVDDLAAACVFLLNLEEAAFGSLLTKDAPPLINVGTGEDVTIRELAETVARVVGFEGRLIFDTTKPDGVPRKLMDVSRMTAMGWRSGVGLEEGIRRTWESVGSFR